SSVGLNAKAMIWSDRNGVTVDAEMDQRLTRFSRSHMQHFAKHRLARYGIAAHYHVTVLNDFTAPRVELASRDLRNRFLLACVKRDQRAACERIANARRRRS